MSGGERYMLSLAGCLRSEHSVSLFWNPEDEEKIRHEVERKFAINLEGITFVENIFTPKTSLLNRLNRSRSYDLIIVLSDGSVPALACPTILHFQTPVEWVNPKGVNNKLKFLNIKKVICNSEYTKKYIDRKFQVNSTVLYPPVSFTSKKEVTKEKIILNVGRFGIRSQGSSFKKQEVLRDVFIQMCKDGLTGWELVFILNVTESETEPVKEFIESVNDTNIKVLISPDVHTVTEYYAKASIYWHAAGFGEDLAVHPDRAEHFGLSTVEAMHYGAVPIVINAGGQPEIVQDNESGLLWETIGELQEKTLRIIEDIQLRKSISQNAKVRSDYYSLQRFCQELKQIIT